MRPLAKIFAWRKQGRSLSVAAHIRGRGYIGLNLHRSGGISITGFPAKGGTTIAWGRLRARGDEMDRQGGTERIRVALGPVAIRVGRDF